MGVPLPQPVAEAFGAFSSAVGGLVRRRKGDPNVEANAMLNEFQYVQSYSTQQVQLQAAGAEGKTSIMGTKWDVYEVDPKDTGTPDGWVQRHPDIIRLTGRHPLNCEPPPSLLHEAGFVTPASIHYVRNHGATPNIKWEEHRITVDGNVPKKKVFTMDDIVKMPRQTLPVTLVCAGNRRKEENMLKKTIGFNWGQSGVSTSVWTGVPMHVFLKQCGITSTSEDRQHLSFKGPDGELPKGDDGSYGTSIPLSMALDPSADVLIAFEQNAQRLTPDHGYPVRIIIPGWIGGRMVKWLTNLSVTKEPSTNHYHFYDNRILPPYVDVEKAEAERWWFKEEYIFNQLNINSAILYPDHGEVVKHVDGVHETVPFGGYAYTGGGRKVNRVELSLDGGLTWRITELTCPEKPTKYNKRWCWVLWKTTVTTQELANSRQICCRAWDEGMNTQPKDITWNVMGMGNNCWFRMKIHRKQLPNDDTLQLELEAPTQAGTGKGGWMGSTAGEWKNTTQYMDPESARTGGDVKDVVVSPVRVAGGQGFTMEEVAKHDLENDCWIVVKDKVYDVTKYLTLHPGGAESILITAGMDSTEEFEAIHSKKAWGLLDDYYIGDLLK